MSLSGKVFPALLLIVLLLLFIILPHLYTVLTAPARPEPVHYLERVPLERLPNGLYAVQVAVGTPGQPVKAIVDTGASLSWVVDASCRTCCAPTTTTTLTTTLTERYNPQQSSTHATLNRSLYKHYRTGEWIRAAVSTDCMAIGALHISAVHLGRVLETNCDEHSTGLLAISPRHYEGSVLDRIKQARRLRFATVQWVNSGCGGAGVVGGDTGDTGDIRSSLCFGADPRRDQRGVIVSCVRSRWIVPLCIAASHETSPNSSEIEALVDTASTHIFLPQHLVDQVRGHPLVHYDRRTERALYTGTPAQLSTLPTFTLTLNGHPVRIPPHVYVRQQEVLLACLKTTFASAPYSAILGLPFITGCCESVLFDFGRLEIVLVLNP